MKIVLPNWVYKVLKHYGNVALPNECLKLNRHSLVEHLSRKLGFRVGIREALYTETEKYGVSDKRYQRTTTYLIAERKKYENIY